MKRVEVAPGLSFPAAELATEVVASLGNRGGGKSNGAAVIVEELLRADIPVVVLDYVGIWPSLRLREGGRRPGGRSVGRRRRRRRRMKFSLRMFAMVWLPLSLVYAVWLVFAGYELARWAGVMLLVVVGFGYLALISLSLEVRGVKPLLDDDSTRS